MLFRSIMKSCDLYNFNLIMRQKPKMINKPSLNIEIDSIEKTHHNIMPTSMPIKEKGKIFMKGKIIGNKSTERKVRSNSPKESGPVKINASIRQHIFVQHSPFPNNKQNIKETTTKPIPSKITRNHLSNKTAQSKTSTGHDCKLAKVICGRGESKSPHEKIIFKDEESKNIRKEQLNEELLEAAENGDIVKITRLLDT